MTDDPKWLKEAEKLVGTAEIDGKANNPAIMKMYKDCGHNGIDYETTAWCAAMVGACLKRAGKPPSSPVELNLMARSYLKYGVPLSKPRPGAIAVWPRGKPPSGHVGFVVSVDEKAGTIKTIEGNVSNKVKYANRNISEAIGYRWPPEGKGIVIPAADAPKATVKEAVKVAAQSQTVRMQLAAPFVLLAGYVMDGGQWMLDFTMGLIAQLPGLGNDIEQAMGTARQFSTWLSLPFAKISLAIVFAFAGLTIYRHTRDKLKWGQT
jgi:uncharacterized protein (TIGR02594 family)